jgi:probable phosphoglycerate mutase
MERRRIYLMRHGAVAYFDRDGRPVAPDDVPLTAEGRRQAAAAAALLDGTQLDRVVSSDLPRAVETAAIVAPRNEVQAWPELREIAGDRFSSIPPAELEREFVGALHGIVPNDKRFLGGETIGELFDRVLPAVDRLLGDAAWDTALVVAHGAVNRAILSHALLGERVFLGRFEQAPGCLNVLDVGSERPSEWIVRAVNIAPCDLAHRVTRLTQMEQYWREYVPRSDTRPDGSANAERAGSLPPSRVVLDANPETGGA